MVASETSDRAMFFIHFIVLITSVLMFSGKTLGERKAYKITNAVVGFGV